MADDVSIGDIKLLQMPQVISFSFDMEEISEEGYALLTGQGDVDFGHRLPNDFCDYCGEPILLQIFRNSGACCALHLEYEYWEEMQDAETDAA